MQPVPSRATAIARATRIASARATGRPSRLPADARARPYSIRDISASPFAGATPGTRKTRTGKVAGLRIPQSVSAVRTPQPRRREPALNLEGRVSHRLAGLLTARLRPLGSASRSQWRVPSRNHTGFPILPLSSGHRTTLFGCEGASVAEVRAGEQKRPTPPTPPSRHPASRPGPAAPSRTDSRPTRQATQQQAAVRTCRRRAP